ncbi:DUF2164 domain-containing protein [Gallaecimonas pentaromativorans]|uniref:DUF2164 domain-containing protein n=1 Tax=Gallaecimonas pentaromativorans TaxID=584787 RepID=UPI00067E7DC5|nr:DUF2164 domain-containing protein [Gallaecimonas pentaromativorans]MED5524881.1 DUF2164 domain-containing protein [Pseudomonadota bacterium]
MSSKSAPPLIRFPNAQKTELLTLLQDWFDKELDQELGQFDAEFLLDFIAAKMGPYFYNQALADAQALIAARLDSLNDGFFELEKPLG